MKKISFIFLALFITASLFAQVPQKMSYQAVVRNSSNQLVTSHTVGIKISILQGSSTGTVIYTETQTQSTNANGLVSIEIGGGSGFNTINWANGPYFIKTETDPTGGMNYTITGTSQLLTVPYALYATTAGNGFSGNYNDLTNKPIIFDGTWVSLTGKPIFASIATSGNYNDLTNKPSLFNGSWISLTDKPTTIAGYGITDAVSTSGVQTIAGNKTFSGTVNINKPINDNNVANKLYVDSLILQVMNSFAKAGETFTSVTTGTIKDVDGNTYHTLKIGSQWWTTENLRVIHYRDGTYIPNITDNTAWNALSSGARCYYSNDSATYAATYGALYNWYAVTDSRNLCPSGWHVPSEVEWVNFATYLGGTNVAGGKVKEIGTTHWNTPNTGATNESGLTALPGGYRTFSSTGLGLYCDFWTSTAISAANAYYVGLVYSSVVLGVNNNYSKSLGISVRCVRD